MSTSLPTIVITGATRGIGRATAFALKDEAHLVLTARDAQALAELEAQLPSAESFVLDLATADGLERGMHELRERGSLETGNGGIAGAVLSAGVWRGGAVEDLSAEDWAHVLHMNVTAQGLLAKALLPELREARGTIAFINSGSGFTSKPTNGLYSASKFALRALSDALREEERANGVRVASIHPGRVATDMQKDLRAFENGEYVESDYVAPETIAAAIRFALFAPEEASVDEIQVRPRG